MIGFEPRTSVIGSDRSTNWATTTALALFRRLLIMLTYHCADPVVHAKVRFSCRKRAPKKHTNIFCKPDEDDRKRSGIFVDQYGQPLMDCVRGSILYLVDWPELLSPGLSLFLSEHVIRNYLVLLCHANTCLWHRLLDLILFYISRNKKVE